MLSCEYPFTISSKSCSSWTSFQLCFLTNFRVALYSFLARRASGYFLSSTFFSSIFDLKPLTSLTSPLGFHFRSGVWKASAFSFSSALSFSLYAISSGITNGCLPSCSYSVSSSSPLFLSDLVTTYFLSLWNCACCYICSNSSSCCCLTCFYLLLWLKSLMDLSNAR